MVLTAMTMGIYLTRANLMAIGLNCSCREGKRREMNGRKEKGKKGKMGVEGERKRNF